MDAAPFTSKRRILATLSGGIPDRVPVSPFVYTYWIESSSHAVASTLVRETDPLVGLPLAPHFNWLLGSEGIKRWRRERNGDVIVDHIDTPRGPLRRVSRLAKRRRADREKNLAGPDSYAIDAQLGETIEVLERLCPTSADLERFLSLPFVPCEPDLTNYLRWSERLGEEALVVPTCYDAFYLAQSLMPPAELRRFMSSAEQAQGLLTILNERVLAMVDASAIAGVQAFFVVGPEYVFSLLGDLRRYSDLVAPYDVELHSRIRARGRLSIDHMHGPVAGLLSEIASTGPDALEPLEGPPGGDVDLATAKRAIGDRVCLIGNIQDFTEIHDGTIGSITNSVLQCLAHAAEGGRYILSGTHSGIYDKVAVENWVRIVRLVDQHGRYHREGLFAS